MHCNAMMRTNRQHPGFQIQIQLLSSRSDPDPAGDDSDDCSGCGQEDDAFHRPSVRRATRSAYRAGSTRFGRRLSNSGRAHIEEDALEMEQVLRALARVLASSSSESHETAPASSAAIAYQPLVDCFVSGNRPVRISSNTSAAVCASVGFASDVTGGPTGVLGAACLTDPDCLRKPGNTQPGEGCHCDTGTKRCVAARKRGKLGEPCQFRFDGAPAFSQVCEDGLYCDGNFTQATPAGGAGAGVITFNGTCRRQVVPGKLCPVLSTGMGMGLPGFHHGDSDSDFGSESTTTTDDPYRQGACWNGSVCVVDLVNATVSTSAPTAHCRAQGSLLVGTIRNVATSSPLQCNAGPDMMCSTGYSSCGEVELEGTLTGLWAPSCSLLPSGDIGTGAGTCDPTDAADVKEALRTGKACVCSGAEDPAESRGQLFPRFAPFTAREHVEKV